MSNNDAMNSEIRFLEEIAQIIGRCNHERV